MPVLSSSDTKAIYELCFTLLGGVTIVTTLVPLAVITLRQRGVEAVLSWSDTKAAGGCVTIETSHLTEITLSQRGVEVENIMVSHRGSVLCTMSTETPLPT